MGQVLKRDAKYDDAHELYTQAGGFIAKYSADPIYGKSAGDNHPLMQQFFLLMHEWAGAGKFADSEAQMLVKYE
jgi:hypothetical protein